MKNNKTAKILVMTVLAFAFAFGFTACGQNDESIDQTLAKIAVEANRDLPMMIDTETRIDKIETLPGKIIRYNNTIVDKAVEEIDLEAFKEGFGRTLLATVRNNPALESFRKKQVTFIYLYRDKAENEIAVFEYTPEDYK